MDLTLYRVIGGQKRVALGDLADGVEFFTAEREVTPDDKVPTGRIILTPVNVVSGAAAPKINDPYNSLPQE